MTTPGIYAKLLIAAQEECFRRGWSLAQLERSAGLAAGSFTELQRERARVPEDAKWEMLAQLLDALGVGDIELVEAHKPRSAA